MSGKGALLLADHPASDDDFGPHARVATGIQNLIEGSSGGKTIAVRGGWGAGKSTVIKLLSRHYANSDVFVYVYDAWVHVGDPLRRAFLSSLVAELIRKGLLKEGKTWSDSQEKLAGRLKETTKRSIPQLTWFSKFLAAALLLVPTGTSVLSEGIKRCATSGEHGGLLAILGAVLSLLPMAGVIGSIANSFRKGESTNEAFAFFVNKSITNEATITTETGAATSIDFQDFFAKVIAEVLDDRNPKRKLVVVIDNLDRLEQDAAKEVWALLRSFLDMPQHSSAAWADRLWVIVPIASENRESSDTDNEASSEGFLTKIFQARFDLPPPVLKNWRPYLAKALSRAFPSITAGEERQILDLYLASMPPGQTLTPRELISFVNDLVALASQWGDSMSLAVLAAYLLDVKSRLKDTQTPGDALRGKTIPSEASERVIERSLRDEFAMIYFNTGTQKEALELLQRPEAERILASGDGESLHAEILKETSFGTISSQVLDEMNPLIRADVSRIFLPLVAVYSARKIPSDPTNSAANDELNATYNRAERLTRQVLASMPSVPYGSEPFLRMADVLISAEKEAHIESIYALMSRQPPADADAIYVAPRPESADSWKAWVQGCLSLIKYDKIQQVIESGDCIPFSELPASDYLKLLEAVPDSTTFDALARSSKHRLLPLLEESIRSRAFTLNSFDIIDWCNARSERQQLSSLSPLLDEAFRQQELNQGFVNGAAQLLCELRDLPSVYSILKSLVAGGVMHHHLFSIQGFPAAAGAIAWCVLAVRPNGNVDQAFGNSGNGQQLVNQLLDSPRGQEAIARGMLDFCKSMEVMNDWISHASAQPRLHNLLALFAEDDQVVQDFIKSLKPDEFRARIDDLAPKLGRNLHDPSLIASRFGDGDFIKELTPHLTRLDDAWLMALSLQLLPDDLRPSVIDSASQMLDSLDEATWLAETDRNPNLQNLIASLKDRGARLALGGQLKSAVMTLLSRYKQTRSGGPETIEKFATLLGALSDDNQKSVADQAYEDLATAPGQFGASWNLLESLISDSLKRQRGTLRIGRRLILPMLNAQDIDGVNGVARILDQDWARQIVQEDSVALADARQKVDELISMDALDPKLANALENLKARL